MMGPSFSAFHFFENPISDGDGLLYRSDCILHNLPLLIILDVMYQLSVDVA